MYTRLVHQFVCQLSFFIGNYSDATVFSWFLCCRKICFF